MSDLTEGRMPARPVEFGPVAYEAYCKAVGGVDWQGKPLKTWEELRDLPQGRAWQEAGMAVARLFVGHGV